MNRADRQSRNGEIDVYLEHVQGDHLLSTAEESALSERVATGDQNARNQMVQANLRLVVKIARDYLGRGLPLEDLIGEGNLGLIRAAEDFDHRFGTRFSTYASYWIKEKIHHALKNTTATIRLPAHMVNLLSKWRKAERTLYRERGQMPSFDEVATRLDLTESQRDLVMRAKHASQIRSDGAGDEGWSDETSGDQESPAVTVERADDRRQLVGRLERLSDRERAVIRLRFGLAGDDPLTYREAGSRLGLSGQWVRRIEARAVCKLAGAS